MFSINTRKIDNSSFSAFPKEKLVKLYKANLVSLYDVRNLNYIALNNSCMTFMRVVPLQAGIIYNRPYLEAMFEKWLTLPTTKQYLSTLGDFDSSNLLSYWVATDIVDICGSGYIFNELEYMEEKPQIIAYIRNTNV